MNEPVVTTPPAIEQDPADTVTQPDGRKLVPVGTLIEERRGRQQERDRAAQLERENQDLRRVKESWDIVEPYLPLLADHPKVTGKPANTAPPPAQDPELVAAAEALGFYNDDGTPDTTRASKAKGFFTTLVKGTVTEQVAPVARSAAEQRAATLRERAYQVVDKQGRPFAQKEHIDAVLDRLPPEAGADPNMVNTALMVARGMGIGSPGEPLYTEGAGGGRPGSGAGLSPLERSAARARGMTDEQWTKTRDTTNDSNLLE